VLLVRASRTARVDGLIYGTGVLVRQRGYGKERGDFRTPNGAERGTIGFVRSFDPARRYVVTARSLRSLMPEGPSLVILREQTRSFARQRILAAEGDSRIDKVRLVGKRIVALRTWGKHFLIELPGFAIRIHFLMFGSYRINERKDRPPRLSLAFARGRELNFYSCAVRYIEGSLDEEYDWRADVLSDAWDPKLARRKLRAMPGTLVCDALLDQNVFAGVGNIIKNEVLFRIRVHPLSRVGQLSPRKLTQLIEQARQYSFDFLEWKKAFVLRKHWLAHTKRTCPRCDIPLKKAHLGTTDRRSFYCERCQVRYAAAARQGRASLRHGGKQRK
jgi:endonuclease-8